MFNKTIIQKGHTEYVPYEKTVTINRAPTDKSVELLNEMQDKAIKNLIKSVNIKDNTMNGTVLYFIQRADWDGVDFIARFSFNGTEHELRGQVNRRDLSETNRYGSQTASTAIAYKLCELMIREVFKGVGVKDLERIGL